MNTDGAERRVGLVHAALTAAALSLYGASWLVRGRGRRGMSLAIAGAGLLGAGGWLGGHLAYALGVGVDTVFQRFPDEWTDVAAPADLQPGRPVRVDVGDVPLLLLRTERGVVALAGRCSHRGGPLDEGDFDGDCITCPWHGSRFDVRGGSVRGGPATRAIQLVELEHPGSPGHLAGGSGSPACQNQTGYSSSRVCRRSAATRRAARAHAAWSG